ncbi:hypothetical protein D9M73_256410 [compost metagenome]
MCKSCWVDQNEVHAFTAGSVDAVDQFVLGVALQVQQMVTGFAGTAFQVLVDLRQRRGAVGARFASAEQVQVGSVQNE